MVQGVLYVGDDKKLTNAAELCIICQWEWKIWGAGTSIKDAISTWQYWTVGISHPLRGISEGQTHALWFFTFFFSFRVPGSFVHPVTVLQSYYQPMNRRILFGCSQCLYIIAVSSGRRRQGTIMQKCIKFDIQNCPERNQQRHTYLLDIMHVISFSFRLPTKVIPNM